MVGALVGRATAAESRYDTTYLFMFHCHHVIFVISQLRSAGNAAPGQFPSQFYQAVNFFAPRARKIGLTAWLTTLENRTCMYVRVCMDFMALITALDLCTRSQDWIQSVSVREVHVVFSTARFKGGGKPCPKTRETGGARVAQWEKALS